LGTLKLIHFGKKKQKQTRYKKGMVGHVWHKMALTVIQIKVFLNKISNFLDKNASIDRDSTNCNYSNKKLRIKNSSF